MTTNSNGGNSSKRKTRNGASSKRHGNKTQVPRGTRRYSHFYLAFIQPLSTMYPRSPPPNVSLYACTRFRSNSQEPTGPFIHPNDQATIGYYTKYSPTLQQIMSSYAVNMVNLTHYPLYRPHSNASCPRVRTPAGLQGWNARTALQQRKQRAHHAAPSRYLTHFASLSCRHLLVHLGRQGVAQPV